ncbi:MAG: hypothetical protein ACLPVF_05510 [Acidimicrobiales bacterium]
MKILYVCTGNLYRSPMAQAMTNVRARERGLDVTAESAGIAESGLPISAKALAALGPMQHEVSDHRSQPILEERFVESDLILGMERLHVREVAVISPPTWERTFTLKEFLRRGEHIGPPGPEQRLGEWLALVGHDRRRQDLLGSSPDDDVDDPVEMSAAEVRMVAKELRGLIERLLDLLGPS